MNKPWLSIVTITKDDSPGLTRTLQSTDVWRAETGVEQIVIFAGDEVHLRNDASVLVSRQVSTGIAGAFNEGLALASGEWVWFLNGGDAVHDALNPDWLKALLSTTQAQLVAGTLHFDGETNPRCMPQLSYQWPLIACWLGHPATLVRRANLLAIGGFSPRWRIAMDYDLWFRLLDSGVSVDVVSIPFARFDVNGISERRDMAVAARREEAQVVLKHSGRMGWVGLKLGLRIIRRVVWAIRYLLLSAIAGTKLL